MWTARGVQPLAVLGHSPLASTKMKFLVSDPMKFIGFPIISCLVYIYIYLKAVIPMVFPFHLAILACSVDPFEATPAQGIKRCRPISESPFGWSSGELIS